MEPQFKVIEKIWNAQLVAVDNNPITVANVVIGVSFVLLGFFVARRLSRKMGEKLLPRLFPDRSNQVIFQTISFYIMATLLVLTALKFANVPLSVFTVLGGALAIGVGFGSQNLVNNFISGIILMIERPIKIGDFVFDFR